MSGFTACSDIGPARESLSTEVIAYVIGILPYYYILIIFLVKLKKGEEKKSPSILNNSRI
jgi:hypothetical protein